MNVINRLFKAKTTQITLEEGAQGNVIEKNRLDFLKNEYFQMGEMFKTYWNGRILLLVTALSIIGYIYKESVEVKHKYEQKKIDLGHYQKIQERIAQSQYDSVELMKSKLDLAYREKDSIKIIQINRALVAIKKSEEDVDLFSDTKRIVLERDNAQIENWIYTAAIFFFLWILNHLLVSLSRGLYLFIHRMEDIAREFQVKDFWTHLPQYFKYNRSDSATFVFYITLHTLNFAFFILLAIYPISISIIKALSNHELITSIESGAILTYSIVFIFAVSNFFIVQNGLNVPSYYEKQKARSIIDRPVSLLESIFAGQKKEMRQSWMDTINFIAADAYSFSKQMSFYYKPNKDIHIFAPKAEEGMVLTMNQQGYQTDTLDYYMEEFVKFASIHEERLSVDVGAAYGIATINALNEGVSIIANDLDERHLDIIYSQAKKLNIDGKLRLNKARFPNQMTFDRNSVAAFLLARVLHFLTPHEVEDGANRLFKWLMPGGKVFVTAETPYLKIFKTFLPIYLDRKTKNPYWGGNIEDIGQYVIADRSVDLPKHMLLMDKESLEFAFKRAGFKIIKCDYLRRERGKFPESFINDDTDPNRGKESIGLICEKPR